MRKNEIDVILCKILEQYPNTSDINVTVGRPLQIEISGELRSAEIEFPIMNLTPFQTELFALNILQGNSQLINTLLTTGSCDCSYQLAHHTRFRVNIFSQRGAYSIVMRKLSNEIPTIEEMMLPETFYKIAEEKNGLVLVTGATGSGKSTSLAALLRHINEQKRYHIITLEDPIEFDHSHINSTFNQRELGLDFDSFANGLKSSLRQSPNVIFVGEMRDKDTVEIALTAAETGHLVLSTIHTVDAGQTINRIVGFFDGEEANLIRMRLSDSLRWVVSQRLVPRIGGGRIAALEIMNNNMRVKDVIVNGETEDKTLYGVIESGSPYGMWTFDQCLLQFFKIGLITQETTMSYCSRRSAVIQGVDKIKASRGEETSDIKGLIMADDDPRHSLGYINVKPQSSPKTPPSLKNPQSFPTRKNSDSFNKGINPTKKNLDIEGLELE